MSKRSRPLRAVTLVDAMVAGLAGETAYWSSSPAAIEIPDLTADPEHGRTIKVDPAVLANLAAARGWVGIPALRADGKRQRLTPQQRVASQITTAMQGIARQALEQATGAGLEGEMAAMVAAVDAATRGFLAALVVTQGRLVGSPNVAAAEVRRGRESRERSSTGGKTSKRAAWITDDQAIAAWRAREDLLNSMPPEEAKALSATEKSQILIDEIEARHGVKYKPRSVEGRVNKALQRG